MYLTCWMEGILGIRVDKWHAGTSNHLLRKIMATSTSNAGPEGYVGVRVVLMNPNLVTYKNSQRCSFEIGSLKLDGPS